MAELLRSEFIYQKLTLNELDDIQKNLVDKAKLATNSAYCNYSHYRVGASVLLDNDEIVTSSNQENAAYPSGHCAESIAVSYAKAQFPGAKIRSVAIAARRDNETDFNPVSPCGKCRQVILEFEIQQKEPIQMILYHHDDHILLIEGVRSLLPISFEDDMMR
jgi:cytidine deaminase